MPMLNITASKKVTATITLEDSLTKQVDEYAAFTKGSADDVVAGALEYIFAKDREFLKWREENNGAKPALPLRIKRPVNANGKNKATKSEHAHSNGTGR